MRGTTKRQQRVGEGYGILQPRVAVSLPGTNRSRYARLCGSEPGIDPYTRAVSDVYQDLFQEGSFIGKGIYDVDAFERALNGRFPENRILSHDLLEGCYARAGLLSDVQLYEEYPSRYSADVSRRHRWIRGDWQIARWLLPGVPGPGARRQKNPLSGLSRWKIFDNLRRSLVPPALTLLLLLGWTVVSPAWFWTLAVIGIILIPPWMASLLELFQKPDDVLLRQHLAAAVRSAGRHSAQAAFTLACLPYEAFFSLDAIVRTAGRMLITHTRLLEWSPSSDPDRRNRADLATFYRTMWSRPRLWPLPERSFWRCRGRPRSSWLDPSWASGLPLPLSRGGSAGRSFAAQRGSRLTRPSFSGSCPERPGRSSRRSSARKITGCRRITFKSIPRRRSRIARRQPTWDWRSSRICRRTTSATFPAGALIERTANAFDTMDGLERHRGHFYNWYDTRSLKPLPPHYISTVDSGNLAGASADVAAGSACAARSQDSRGTMV